MPKCSLNVAVVVGLMAAGSTCVSGQSPGEFFEVVAVTPSRLITHEIELKDQFDEQVVEADLEGPKLFSHAVGVGDKSARQPATYLNWYAITRPTTASTRPLSVRDSLRGGDAYNIAINKPAFLLSPAQRVTTGAPSDIPETLNYFKAYVITNGEQTKREVTLNGAFGPEKRTVLKAAYFCVPAERWHHDERSPIKSAEHCMVIYELKPEEYKDAITTLDQFGLNKLEATSSNWLCVPALIEGGQASNR
jgi:hypothetical protein